MFRLLHFAALLLVSSSAPNARRKTRHVQSVNDVTHLAEKLVQLQSSLLLSHDKDGPCGLDLAGNDTAAALKSEIPARARSL